MSNCTNFSRTLTIFVIFCLTGVLGISGKAAHADAEKSNLNVKVLVLDSFPGKQVSRSHGEKVTSIFKKILDSYSCHTNVQIFQRSVFDDNGYQKENLWKDSLTWAQKSHVNLIVSASAYVFQKNESEAPGKFPGIPAMFASGTVGKGIDEQTMLYPHQIRHSSRPVSRSPYVILIGQYLDSKSVNGKRIIPPGHLYRDSIGFYESGENDQDFQLNGTSKAVSIASAKAICFCRTEIVGKDMKRLMKCLSRHLITSSDPSLLPM